LGAKLINFRISDKQVFYSSSEITFTKQPPIQQFVSLKNFIGN